LSLDAASILSKISSHAKTLGIFERVLTHEPKADPGSGITASIWYSRLDPINASSLIATSVRLELSCRIYINMTAEPQDSIDLRLLNATSKLMESFTGDFDLGGSVWYVDLLNAQGDGLSAKGGYVALGNAMFRVSVLTIPIIVPDVWTQTA
jgi:hypothetical protein